MSPLQRTPQSSRPVIAASLLPLVLGGLFLSGCSSAVTRKGKDSERGARLGAVAKAEVPAPQPVTTFSVTVSDSDNDNEAATIAQTVSAASPGLPAITVINPNVVTGSIPPARTEPVRPARALLVGKVTLVNPAASFALIELDNNYTPRAGVPLASFPPGVLEGDPRARLIVAPEQRRPFITADFREGAPLVGDLVYQDYTPPQKGAMIPLAGNNPFKKSILNEEIHNDTLGLPGRQNNPSPLASLAPPAPRPLALLRLPAAPSAPANLASPDRAIMNQSFTAARRLPAVPEQNDLLLFSESPTPAPADLPATFNVTPDQPAPTSAPAPSAKPPAPATPAAHDPSASIAAPAPLHTLAQGGN